MCDLNWILRQNKKRINNIKKGKKKKKAIMTLLGQLGKKINELYTGSYYCIA